MRIKNSLKNIMTGLLGQLIVTITGFITRTVFIYVLGATLFRRKWIIFKCFDIAIFC